MIRSKHLYQAYGIMLLLVVLSCVAHAGGESTIGYRSGRDSVQAFLVVPDGKGPYPAVLLIHEWWGLNDWIKDNARRFAKLGYAALAIDLFRGKSTSSPDTAHEIMRGLPEDRAARDIQSAAAFLASRSDVIPSKIGVIGWCMGGGYALVAAMNVPSIAGTVICYGRLVTDSASIASINGPLLGIFGKEDNGIPAESVLEFERACRDAGKEIKVQIYDHAGHAFMNPNNLKGYSARSSDDAWSRINGFFEQHLKK